MVDESRLVTATALAVEDESVDAALYLVFQIGKGVEMESNETLAVTMA